jgi:hypothetical protein
VTWLEFLKQQPIMTEGVKEIERKHRERRSDMKIRKARETNGQWRRPAKQPRAAE